MCSIVNETNPEGYANHPYWSGLTYEAKGCTGESLATYRTAQFNKMEAWLQNMLTAGWNAVAILALAHRVALGSIRWRGAAASARHITGAAILGYMGGLMVLAHTVNRTVALGVARGSF